MSSITKIIMIKVLEMYANNSWFNYIYKICGFVNENVIFS